MFPETGTQPARRDPRDSELPTGIVVPWVLPPSRPPAGRITTCTTRQPTC